MVHPPRLGGVLWAIGQHSCEEVYLADGPAGGGVDTGCPSEQDILTLARCVVWAVRRLAGPAQVSGDPMGCAADAALHDFLGL